MRAGDYLVKVGTVDVGDTQDFGPIFRARYATERENAPLAVVVRREGRTLTLSGRLRFAENVSYRMVEVEGASAKATRIREGILKGTVTR